MEHCLFRRLEKRDGSLSSMKVLLVLLVIAALAGVGAWYYFSPEPVSKVQFANDKDEVCHTQKEVSVGLVVSPPNEKPISLTYRVEQRFGNGRKQEEERQVVLAAGKGNATLALPLPKDQFDRLDSQYTITLVNAIGGELGAIKRQIVQVIDCTPKIPGVFLGNPSREKLKSGEVSIPVYVNPSSREPIQVSYSFQAEPPELGNGYQVLSQQPLKFIGGQKEAEIRIRIKPLKDTSGTLVVRLQATPQTPYQKRAPYQRKITVLENFDAPQIFAKFQKSNVLEGATKKAELVFDVRPPVRKPITIRVMPGGSAKNNVDFKGLPDLIRIPKDTLQFVQKFDVLDNNDPQKERVLELKLSTDSRLARLQDTKATLTVQDDETDGKVLLLVPFTKHLETEWEILEPQFETLLQGKLKSSFLGRGLYVVDAEGRTRVWRPGQPPPTTEADSFVKIGLGQHPANAFVPCFKVVERLGKVRSKNDFATIILYRSEEIPNAMKGRGGRHDKLYNQPKNRTAFVFWIVSEPLRKIRRDLWLKKHFNPVVDRRGYFGDRVIGIGQFAARVEGLFAE